MPDNITLTTDVAPAVELYYDRVLLEAAKENEVYLAHAQKASMPTKSGNTKKWHRYPHLAAATTPMPEGQDPPPNKMEQESLTVKMQWYGKYIHVIEEVDMTNQDPVLTIAAERNGYQANLTFETLMRDILSASASSTNASGGSNGNTPTEITRGDVDTVVLSLLGGNAKFVTKMVKAGTGVGSAPLRPAFRAVIHQELLMDLEACTGFVSMAAYASQDGVGQWEWGALGNTRIDWTTNAAKSADGTPIYSIPVYGADAYGAVDMEGIKSIVKGFDKAGSVLNRYATSGWSHAWAGRILNDAWIHNLRVTKDT